MIKNIIFDFGDIFINLDKPATAREMKKYGFKTITPELDVLFKQFEMGLVTSDEFLNRTGRVFPQASRQNLIKAWNAILLDFPETRLAFLEELAAKKEYRLFLLSNTNELHIESVQHKMGALWPRFKNAFENFYLSHEIKKRKPNPDIFLYVLSANELLPEETFFVDDTKENTDAAARLGIKTWNLIVGEEDITELKSRL
ncbi:MAG: HAD family phosphatase [Bacteroidota bacterium]